MRLLRLSLLVVLPALLLLAVEPQAAPAAAPASPTAPGDIDCDGNVTALDALGILGSIAGTEAAGGCLAINGDLTCDERQDQEDIVEILALLAQVQRAQCGGAVTPIDLIQTALDNDEINEEEAALYSVFAAFDDPRLPGQFAATMPTSFEMPVDMSLVGSQLDGFSAAVQAQLEPFFIPPMHQGSWWDLRYGASATPAGIGTPPAPIPILAGEWGAVCRDVASDRVEEVIIIATNSVSEKDYTIYSPAIHDPTAFGGGPKAWVSDIGCWRWEGSITSVVHGEGWELTTAVNDLVLQRDESQAFPFGAPYAVNYIATGGTMDWSYSGSLGECTVSGSETGLPLAQDQSSFFTTIDVISGAGARSAAGVFYPQQAFLPYTIACPDRPLEQADWAASVSFPLSAEPFKVEDGSVIAGSMQLDNLTVTWRFEAQRE